MAYRGFPTDLERIAIYLRKSREDSEAEERAKRQGLAVIETLSRHRKRLLELARTHNYNIVAIFEEVVSGEFIDERPEIQELLEWVEDGKLDGVLCIDMERLGRGDSADQGVILRTFRDAETLIITEEKVYDLLDDSDEEMAEFRAFFARRELKTITRRMQNGRKDSVKEGAYIGTYEPYGYDRDRNKGLKLFPNHRAEIVQLIFQWYVNKGIGAPTIAERLNAMGIPSPSNEHRMKRGEPVDANVIWAGPSVHAILKNEVYVGTIQWQKTKTVRRKLENGRYKKVKSVDRPKDEWLERENQHEPLVDKATFEAAQKILASRSNADYKNRTSKNPLKGLIICKVCGGKMQLRPYKTQAAHLICPKKRCNRSSQFVYVESKLIEALRTWLESLKIRYDVIDREMTKTKQKKVSPRNFLQEVEREIADVKVQKDNVFKFFERGTYDEETFLERSQVLQAELKRLQDKRHTLLDEAKSQENEEVTKNNVVPLIRQVLDAYELAKDPKEKNHLLRQVIEKVEYYKAPEAIEDNFELVIHHKM